MAGAYVSLPDTEDEWDGPEDWNINWPFPGPQPPGFTPVDFGVDENGDENPGPVKVVEQDWIMSVSNPTPADTSPQVLCVISPVFNLDFEQGWFYFNYREMPDFHSGGVAAGLWYGDTFIKGKYINPDEELSSSQIITWTQRMSSYKRDADYKIKFSIKDGYSDEWGWFGTVKRLQLVSATTGKPYRPGDVGTFVYANVEVGKPIGVSVVTNLTDLEEYQVDASVDESYIGYGSNRVDYIKIIAQRQYNGNGDLISSSTSEYVIYP